MLAVIRNLILRINFEVIVIYYVEREGKVEFIITAQEIKLKTSFYRRAFAINIQYKMSAVFNQPIPKSRVN